MIVTFKDFHKLKFPVYPLPSDDWYSVDKVLFLQEQVLDEKNMPGETLGIRRLQCARSDLLPLKQAILDLPDLIRSKKKFFIDSNGKPFIYQKTKSVPLKCHRIKKIEKKETASLIWLNDSSSPFIIPRPPAYEYPFVRILHYLKAPYLLYDYSMVSTKDTTRRI